MAKAQEAKRFGSLTEPEKVFETSLCSTPHYHAIEILEESEQDKNPHRLLQIRGVASRGGVVNKNNRLYPVETLAKAVHEAQKDIAEGKLLGELDHPETPRGGRLKHAAMKFTKLWMDGDLMWFEADVLPTKSGRDLYALLISGVGVGMSTRGQGTSVIAEVGGRQVAIIQDDFRLHGIDAVLNESNVDGKVYDFKEGEESMTVEQLMKEYPELVEEIKESVRMEVLESTQKQVREELEKEFETKLAIALKEKEEAITAKVMESEEIARNTAVINEVLKAVKPLLNANMLEESEDDKVQVLQSVVEEKEEKIKLLESKLEALQNQLTEAANRAKAQAKIDELVKGHRFEKQLRERLLECTSEEEVEKAFAKEEKFITALLEGTKVPTGNGAYLEESEEAPELDELKAKQRRLAGLS